jgi:hypothetical protein
MTDLSGLAAVITGGNDGIGYGIAEAVAQAGADVAVWGRRAERNEAAAASLAELGVSTAAATCDVSDETQVDAAMAHTLEALGKVDILVANAGRGGQGHTILDTSLEEWRAVTSVNLDGTFLCLQAAARHMVDRGEGGALVTVASTSAFHGAPRNDAYGASKAGVLALTRSMAVGLARHRIRVNALCPGWTRTELSELGYQNEGFREIVTRRTPVRRWADPSEMGPAAVYLADPRHTFHTGDHLVVDGGYTIF